MDNALMDRRHTSPGRSPLWNDLNTPQQFSVSTLSKFGYDLAFIRNENSQPLAIMINGDQIAVVDAGGDVNSTPNITIR